MSLRSLLLSMAFKLERKLNSVFSTDVKMQIDYIQHFKEPTDDIERSFFQYKCQMKLYGKSTAVFLNIASFPLALYYLVSIKKVKDGSKYRTNTAAFLRDGKPENILPNSVSNRYDHLIADPETGSVLSKSDILFIRELVQRYPFSWLFVLKILLKTALYRSVIEKYSPAALIVCNEYSFTSSAMTEYCRRQGVLHINVMHGEKLFYMREAFFHFDECHIWGEEYYGLFEELRAERSQFIISIPPSLHFDHEEEIEPEVDYTYYLAAETDEVLDKISVALNELHKRGFVIAVRPHPRYSNTDSVGYYFADYKIEDCKSLSIEKSVLRTKNAISLYSTVLNQAYHNGVNVVIDDISNPDYYNKLIELRYALLSSRHDLLSHVLAN